MTINLTYPDQLKSIVELIEHLEEDIEHLEEEKAATLAYIKDVYAEAKSNGYDTKALKEVTKQRKIERDARLEQEAIVDLYKQALGMV
jgi:uncharacterized protein (UPF0335 family)